MTTAPTYTVHQVHGTDKEGTFKILCEYAGSGVRWDVTITDPPFNADVQNNLCSGSLVGTKNVPKRELAFNPVTEWSWVKPLVNLTRRWTLIYCAVEDFGIIKAAYPEAYVRSGIVYKPNSMGQLTRDRPATSYEGIAILHNPLTKLRWNGAGSYGIWRCNSTRGKPDRHDNEKHIDILLKLTALFSDRGETIFDGFCGSGSGGEAAKRLGRSWVGWERDAHWVVRTRERLATVESGCTSDDEALALCSMREGTAPAKPKKKETFQL